MPHSDAQSRLNDPLKLLGAAVIYALFAHIVHLYFKSDTAASVFEPASGWALAALLIGGRRYAWGVFLGALLINAMSSNPLWVAAAIALGNTLGALFGAWLLTRDGRFDSRIRSLRDYLRLILLGGSRQQHRRPDRLHGTAAFRSLARRKLFHGYGSLVDGRCARHYPDYPAISGLAFGKK